MNVTTRDIKEAILKKHDRDFVAFEVSAGAEWARMDCVAMRKSWARPAITGYEIKVSRQDFVKDHKWDQYLPYCNGFYFICPWGLIEKDEVGQGIGLCWVSGGSHRVSIRKKAEFKKEINANIYKRIIMSKLESDRYPFHNDKVAFFQDWLMNKKSNRELGYMVNTKLVREMNELQHQIKLNEQAGAHLEEIRKMLLEAGYSVYNVSSAVEKAIEDSKGGKHFTYLKLHLENVVGTCSKILETLNNG